MNRNSKRALRYRNRNKYNKENKKKNKIKENNCSVSSNKQFENCIKCCFFPSFTIQNAPYYLDKYGIKHRDIKYICSYDLHEILPKTNICPRCQK